MTPDRRNHPAPTKSRRRARLDDERAGSVEAFEDPALYDWEYRRRRRDVAFYRMLAHERGGPVLDLACGSGRILAPLVRDGHVVVGLDLSRAMLGAAARRLRTLPAARRRHALLLRADLRAFAFRRRFPLIIAAFHSVQHLITDGDLLRLLRAVRRCLGPGGWFAFDIFVPSAAFLARPPDRQFDRTVFQHPVTGRRHAYTVSHYLDATRRALHMRFHYQPLNRAGHSQGAASVVRLCHRQLSAREVASLLRRAGMKLLACWTGFGPGEPMVTVAQADRASSEQLVFLATPVEGRPAPGSVG